MMSNGGFSWIPAYEAIADKLLEYEGNQEELCDLVEKIIGERYNEMDPFTFYSMFNGKRKNFDKRIEAVQAIIKWFGLDVAVPSDFDGLPVTNPRQWRYWDGGTDTVKHNWHLFRSAINLADGESDEQINFANLYDVVRAQGCIGDANLTMALFWVRPKFFLPVDNNTRAYLWNRYDIAVPAPLKGEGYLALLNEVRETAHVDFTRISYEAWELGGWIPAPHMTITMSREK